MPDKPKDYVAIAEQYARAVVARKVLACKHVQAACKRHLEDLKRSKTGAFPYRFDATVAALPCAFAEMLPHVKGKWAKKHERIVLQPWQCFILCCIFGWLKKKNDTRRFTEAYLEIPRKNGKSVLAAVIGLYMFTLDGEHGAEVYSGATSEKQAWEVFRPAKMMFEHEMCGDLREMCGGEAFAKSLYAGVDGSRFEPIIGKPGDGASPSCAIADEFHEHDTPDQVDTMQTGMLAREQPLMIIPTTAGVNLAGPCYDKRADAIKVLQGALENDQLFAIIYSIDLPEHEGEKGDDWTDPKILPKANPNYGISVDPDILQAAQRQAVLNPIHQNRFKTKHLNVWCAAKMAWMPLPQWNLCGDAALSLDEFMGEEVWIILDLASKDDLAALVLLFRKMVHGEAHYYVFAKYYVPEDKVNDEDNPNGSKYRKWVAQEWLTQTDGAEIDFGVIREDVLDFKNKFQVRELVYDPWRATQLAQEVRAEGATTVEVRQTVEQLSMPMKETLSAVRGSRFHHNCNPVTTWMVSNVSAKTDKKDNIYPTKEQPQMKIDGAVGIIMGMARAIIAPDEGNFDDWLRDQGGGGTAAKVAA